MSQNQRKTDTTADEKRGSFFLKVSNIAYNVFQRKKRCKKEHVNEQREYELITSNNANSITTIADIDKDYVNVYDYVDANIVIN